MEQTIRDKEVTTRKIHRCWGCGDTYPRGSKLWCVTTVGDGEISNTYWCIVCNTAWNEWQCRFDDEIGFAELKNEHPEEWEEIAKSIRG